VIRTVLVPLVALATGLALGRMPASAPVPFSQVGGPRPEHTFLNAFEGDWDFVARVAMSGHDLEMKGRLEARLVCNGTWLLSQGSGEFMGRPYDNVSLMGYDARKGEYVTSWIDAAKDFLDPMTGRIDDEGQLVTIGPIPSPLNPAERVRARGTLIPGDGDRYEYVEELDDGKGGWTPWLRTTYTRRAE
jgi:hypothetical protein